MYIYICNIYIYTYVIYIYVIYIYIYTYICNIYMYTCNIYIYVYILWGILFYIRTWSFPWWFRSQVLLHHSQIHPDAAVFEQAVVIYPRKSSKNDGKRRETLGKWGENSVMPWPVACGRRRHFLIQARRLQSPFNIWSGVKFSFTLLLRRHSLWMFFGTFPPSGEDWICHGL